MQISLERNPRVCAIDVMSIFLGLSISMRAFSLASIACVQAPWLGFTLSGQSSALNLYLPFSPKGLSVPDLVVLGCQVP